MSELLPCPFCNGAASLIWSGGFRYAQCSECGVSTHNGDGEGIEEIDRSASGKWNRRSTPASSATAEDVRDAERYRFLRQDATWETPWITVAGGSTRWNWLSHARADEAIDEAIARQRGEGKTPPEDPSGA